MKSKLKYITFFTFIFISILLIGLVFNNFNTNKVEKVISYNNEILANETDLAIVYIRKGSTTLYTLDQDTLSSNNVFSYTLDYDVSEISILGAAVNPYSTVSGSGNYSLKRGLNEIRLTVTHSSGVTKIYTFNITRSDLPAGEHSAALYALKIRNLPEYILSVDKTSYSYNIPSGWYFIDVEAIPFDEGNVRITYEGFEYVTKTKDCKVIVENLVDTSLTRTYTFKLVKTNMTNGSGFNYTGYTSTYTAPYEGFYRLEAWGAQGGSDGSIGGYGGYSMGILPMSVSQKVYVTVGGAGTGCATSSGGGFNGGGNAGNRGCSGGGGGATHIAYDRGLLSDLSSTIGELDQDAETYRSSSVIMVAGGGGGGGYLSNGASAGGFRGLNAGENGGSGGSQLNYGSGISPGAFGHGGNRTNGDGGGGGAGFFGGGAALGDSGGGGGSGYIGNSALISVGNYTKHMTCYRCTEATGSTNKDIRTISTSSTSRNAVANAAKLGNGYAQITYLDLSENKYLTNLRVLQQSNQNVIPFDDDELFEYDKTLYEITLPSDLLRVTIQASADDPTLKIAGDLGDKKIPAGTTDYKITTTSELGESVVYTIRITRAPSEVITVNNIAINGLISKYCAYDFDADFDGEYDKKLTGNTDPDDYLDFCKLYEGYAPGSMIGNSESATQTTWTPDNEFYDIFVPARVKEIDIEVVSENDNQYISGAGQRVLVPGTNTIAIDVVSEKCYIDYGLNPPEEEGCTKGYIFNIYRDYYHDADLYDLKIRDDLITEDDWAYGKSFDLNFTDPEVLNYYITVPYTWKNVKYLEYSPDIYLPNYPSDMSIDPEVHNAVIEIYGNDGDVNPEHEFKVGETNLVEIKVFAPDKVDSDGNIYESIEGTTQSYYLHVYREYSDNALLENLQYYNKDVVEQPLAPPFRNRIFEYNVTVPTNNDIGYVRLKPQESTSRVTVRNETTRQTFTTSVNANFEYFAQVELARGLNDITITLLAEDNNTTGVYHLNVLREYSSDATVTNIRAYTGSTTWDLVPDFDPEIHKYSFEVDKGIERVDYDVTKNDPNAKVTVQEGNGVQCGDTTHTIVIESEDGTSSETYVFNIHREPFDIATLSNITITSDGIGDVGNVYPIDPVFNSSVFEYTANVPHLVNKAYVNYTKTNKFATVNTNASNSSSVNLSVGENVFYFEVTAEDGETKTNYVLKIYREISDDVSIRDLKIDYTSYYVGGNITKAPDEPISSYIVAYTSSIPYYYTHGKISVTPSVPTATVTGDLNTRELDYGENIFNFRITTDGNTEYQDYTVTITRIFDENVGLRSLVLLNEFGEEQTLTPTFDSTKLSYTANVSDGSNYVTIRAVPNNVTSVVVGAGRQTLNYGVNNYEIKVTNYDTETHLSYTEVYKLKVTRNLNSVACINYLELYYSDYYYSRRTIWSKYYNEACSDEEYTIYVRSGDRIRYTYSNFYRISTYLTTDGPLSNYVKGNSYTFHIYVHSQDGSNTTTYTFNVVYPEWVGSKYLSSLSVSDESDGVNIYTLDPAYERTSGGPYTVIGNNETFNVPYEVSRVYINAVKEDPLAVLGGAGWRPLNTGDNTATVNVTSYETGEVMTYTLSINREHGHDATLKSLTARYTSKWEEIIPSETFDFKTDETLTTDKPFDKDDEGPYYLLVTSQAQPLSSSIIKAVSSDPNATVEMPSNVVLNMDTFTDFVVKVTAEDGTTTKEYTIKAKREIGTISYGNSLCVYNAHDDRCETMYGSPVLNENDNNQDPVSFYPTRYNYYVTVNSLFGYELNSDNVLFDTLDPNAHITRSSPVALRDKEYVEYTITVVAEDATSSKIYHVYVKLILSDDPTIATVTIPYGFLLNTETFVKGFVSQDREHTDYYWIVPDEYYSFVNESLLSYTMSHPRAWSELLYNSDQKIFTVNTRSEDESNSLQYNFIVKSYSTVDVTAKSMVIRDPEKKEDPDDPDDLGYIYNYTPPLEDFVFNYETHIYKSTNKLKIDFELTNPSDTISVDLSEPFDIISDDQYITFSVTSSTGDLTVPYSIHVIRDILDDKFIQDLYLMDENEVCESYECVLMPSFNPEGLAYIVDIPNEYTNMYFYVKLNEQQRVEFFVNNDFDHPVRNRTYNTSGGSNDIVYEGYEFPIGLTQVDIRVYDGLNNATAKYTILVYKGRSHETRIEDLRPIKDRTEGTYYKFEEGKFNPEKLTYGVTVPEGTLSLDFEYDLGHPAQSVIIQGNANLNSGVNHATVTVLAEDGYTERTYDVYINVGGEYTSWLANLTVSTGLKFYDLSPTFYKMETNYTVILPSSAVQVIVEGTPDNATISVQGNGSYDVSTGYNEVTIKALYYDPEDSTNLLSETDYKVRLYRVNPNNVRLESLTVREGTLSPEFDKGTTNYTVNVPAGTRSLTIRAVPEYENAVVTINGNRNFHSGYNIVNVVVQSEDGNLSKTYQLNVFVRPSNDSTLRMIDVYSDQNKNTRYGIKNFDPATHEYTLRVPYNVDSVYIEATPNISTATIKGTGVNALGYGENIIPIEITSEDGTAVSYYYINVIRDYNLLLKSLTNDLDLELDPEFDPLVNNYNLEVPNEVKSIQFFATAQAGSAVSLAYSPITVLEIGENSIPFIVSDPFGNTNVYTVRINRIGSDNNYLANLVPSNGILQERFEKTVQDYTLLLPDNDPFINLDEWIILPEDERSTYTVTGYNNIQLNSTTNKIKIIVESQTGRTRTYTLNIEFRDPSYFKHYLSALWVDDGNLSPRYDMDIVSYTVTMPYSASTAKIHAIPLNTSESVFIDDVQVYKDDMDINNSYARKVDLKFGRNVFRIKVDAEEAGYKIYSLVIYRSSAADPTLAALYVEGYTYTPIFNKNITRYNLTIPSSVRDLNVRYVPSDPASTVVITGNTDLNPDEVNTISVEVTAPDGVKKQTYQIFVTLEKDKDNYLEDLQVVGYNLEPSFVTSDTGTYNARVPSEVSSVLLIADASSETADVKIESSNNEYEGTDYVSGVVRLNPGNNFIQVTVTADSGDVRVYTVNVFKAYKTISSLMALYTEFKDNDTNISITQDGYAPAFQTSNLVYYETVPYYENGYYTVIGIRTDSSSRIVSQASTKLNEGENEIPIKVIAEDGETSTTYIIRVTMERGPTSLLKDLKVTEGELVEKFDKNTFNYYLEVPYEIDHLDFNDSSNPNGLDSIIPLDENATYTITGNSNFTQNGVSTVTIRVSCPTVDDTVYTLEVYRSVRPTNDSEDILKSLYIKNYPFTPAYSPYTLYYTREVDNTVSKVMVGATKTDTTSTIIIDGVTMGAGGGEKEVELDYGVNTVYVKVIAPNGAKRTYSIDITRKDTANFLTQLESNTGTWDTIPTEELLKTKFDYEISLPEGVTEIKLRGRWSEGATATNINYTDTTVQVPPGSNLIYRISVISASGETNTYTITIHGAISGETAIDLDTDKGKPTYLGDNKYELTVEDSASTIVLNVTPSDSGANVQIQPFYALNYGETVITFRVISSDTTNTETYTLKVTRGKDIESITPNVDEIVVPVGEYYDKLTYTVEPMDAQDSEVVFVSLDLTIASVDQDGKVLGLNEGLTKVEIRSAKDPGIKGVVNVYVLAKQITSDVYHVAHTTDEDNPFNIYELDYVSGSQPKVTIDEYLDNFNNPATLLHVYSAGEEVLDYSQYVGTGMILKLIIGDIVYDEIIIVVKGDNGDPEAPGDGIVLRADVATLNNITSGKLLPPNLSRCIFDLDYDGMAIASDLSKISLYVQSKTSEISQS